MRDNEALRHRIDLLLRRLYGPRGERFDPNQLLLFAEMAAGQDTATEAPTEPAAAAKPKRRCRPHGRRRLPDNLPREPRHHELSEAERVCPACGQVRVDIGTDRSEQLDYRPASLFVIEHFVHKYACPCCSQRQSQSQGQQACPGQESEPMPAPQPDPEPAPPPTEPTPTPTPADAGPEPVAPGPQPTDPSQPPQPEAQPFLLPDPGEVVIAAPKPAMPIAKGLPGPGLLAHLIVSKYVDHLPLYRLERIYERQGLFLPRSTMCDWMAACAELLRPLYDLMVSVVLQSRALHTDDTPVKMQEPVTHLLSTARLLGLPGRRRPSVQRLRLHDQPQARRPAAVPGQLPGLPARRRLQRLRRPVPAGPAHGAARIIEVACNAHARRKFYEARGSDALALAPGVGLLPPALRAGAGRPRTSATRSVCRCVRTWRCRSWSQFHAWLEAQRPEVLPKSPMAEAIGYALNNWTALSALYRGGLPGDRQQRGRARDEADRHWPQELVVRRLAARRPDGGGAVQLHVHLPARWASSRGRICKTC